MADSRLATLYASICLVSLRLSNRIHPASPSPIHSELGPLYLRQRGDSLTLYTPWPPTSGMLHHASVSPWWLPQRHNTAHTHLSACCQCAKLPPRFYQSLISNGCS